MITLLTVLLAQWISSEAPLVSVTPDATNTPYNGWSIDRGRNLATDYVNKLRATGLRTDKQVAITRTDANTLLVYRPLGGPFWLEAELKNTGVGCSSNCPYSWDQTRIATFVSYIALAYNASLTYTGAWNNLDSGSADLYIGGHAKWSGTATNHVDLTFTGGGDLYVIFIGRTNGGYVKVQIDGSDANANVLPVGGTGSYHFLDTYTAIDLSYKQMVKVATGLTSASHTVVLTLMSDVNPLNVSGLSRFYFNGLGLVGKDQGIPIQTNTHTPQWVTGTTYVTDDWVTNNGKFYFATGGGVAGASAPTCGSGTCSDGTVTWQFSAGSSYDLNSHIIQSAGSQVEYAIQHKPSGASSFQQMGGVVHGNETLTSLIVDVEGQDFVGKPTIGAWISGDTINIVQQINGTHPDTGATVIATEQLVHRFTSSEITIFHSHKWNVADVIGWYYTAMWPLYHWGVPTTGSFKYAFDNMFTPQGGKKLASSYYGQNNPIVGRSQDFFMQASGGVLQPAGAAGSPSAVAPTYTAIAAIYCLPQSVNEYRQPGSLYASMGMNISNVTPPGFSSDVLKMYFERVPTSPTVSVAVNDVWQSQAVYFLQLVPIYPYDPTF